MSTDKSAERSADKPYLSHAEQVILNKQNLHGWEEGKYHDGPCCGGCIGEQELGYSGGGYFCCCHDGETALENNDYQPKYPPVNGQLPPEFQNWGTHSQVRYLKRYWKEIKASYGDCLLVTHMGRCRNPSCISDLPVETMKKFIWGTND